MLRNTQERWGSLSIGLHWTIAALVLLLQVPVAIVMLALDPGPARMLPSIFTRRTGS